ncbi:MAG: hypothetical protein KIT84_31860 [Labilithrix sp.]|nr:hypothetical protein [Labilithrix sp.]MCW5815667.1 hypothetical protein [Labilithrix sp.]
MIGFRVTGARADPHAAAPTIVFGLRIEEPSGAHIHAIALQAQLRLEPARRRHDPDEQHALGEVFGEPGRWGQTLRPLHWADVARMVPAFEGSTEIDVAVPCTYDLDVAASKYLHAMRDGAVPVRFLFRGTVFVASERGFSVSMLPWDREAAFDLPVATWRATMDAFFPQQGWLRLGRDVLDALVTFKSSRALPTWDAVMRELLGAEAIKERRRKEALS